jgi:hypothetical protein
MPSYSLELGPDGAPPDSIIAKTIAFNYKSGKRRNERIVLRDSGCDLSPTVGFCSDCEAFVNGDKCNSCMICSDDFEGYDVDCENLSTNASFSTCDASAAPVDGVFEGFGFSKCFFEPPENDQCLNATMLHLNSPKLGTLNGATSDKIIADCENPIGGDGVWYTVQGTGKKMTISSCGSPTFINMSFSVYSASSDLICDNLLLCVDSINSGCFNFHLGGTVSWESENSTVYYIHAKSDAEALDQRFKLVATDFSTPENIDCPVSEPVSVVDDLVSTLDLAGSPFIEDSCGQVGTPGVWYKYTAMQEGIVRASTCSMKTLIRTHISVMDGENCDSLTCLEAASGFDSFPGCVEGGTFVDWNATSGKSYYIFVRGSDSYGIMNISIDALAVPENDFCTSATAMELDAYLTPTTAGATVDSVPTCGLMSSNERPGIWFTARGSGKPISVSTCNAQTKIPTFIWVYTGTCNNLTCITGGGSCQDATAGATSWYAEDGVDYFILVQSEGDLGGKVGLNVTEFDSLENDLCSTAVQIEINGNNAVGTTQGATSGTYDGTDCTYSTESPDVWYYVEGNGEVLEASTCSDKLAFDSYLSVFGGRCDRLECIGASSNSTGSCAESGQFESASIRWRTAVGEPYYILVQSKNAEVGAFSLSVKSVQVPENDVCANAKLMDLESGSTVTGNTYEATQDMSFVDICNTQSSGGDLWYQVIGLRNNSLIVASTCHAETSFDSQLSVYKALSNGVSCSELECVSTYNDTCSGDQIGVQVSWESQEGEIYVIRVHGGVNQGVGTFVLDVMELTRSDENCENATFIALSESSPSSIVEGSVVGPGAPASNVIVSACGQPRNDPDAWFRISDVSGEVTVSTCGEETNFDTILEVFEGGCRSSLTCLVLNDDDPTPPETSRPSCSTGTWLAEDGKDYFVRVSGFSGGWGDFELLLSLQ